MRAEAERIARMDGFQQAKYGIGRGAGMLAGAGMEAAGYQNPAIEQAKMREQVMGMGGDLSTSAGLKAKAAQFAEAGDRRTAMALVLKARQMEAEESKMKLESAKTTQEYTRANLDIAQAQKALRENPNLKITEVGVPNKNGWMQRVIFDTTKPDAPYQEIGDPYMTAAAVKAGNTVIHNPAPITPVKVTDPKDPSRVLEVDGRTYKGGTIGDAGVIGVSSKLGDLNKADLKLQQALPQAKLRTDAMAQNFAKLDAALDALDKHPGLPQITGTLYGRTPNVSDNAIDADAQLNTIKSQIFQDSLQAMREASKTGGAVGNVSDREGDKLERTFGALDRVQTTKQFKDQVKIVRNQVKQSMALIKAAFDDQFSGVEPYRVAKTQSTAGSISPQKPKFLGFEEPK
jgi:hypothetical protein